MVGPRQLTFREGGGEGCDDRLRPTAGGTRGVSRIYRAKCLSGACIAVLAYLFSLASNHKGERLDSRRTLFTRVNACLQSVGRCYQTLALSSVRHPCWHVSRDTIFCLLA